MLVATYTSSVNGGNLTIMLLHDYARQAYRVYKVDMTLTRTDSSSQRMLATIIACMHTVLIQL